MFAKTSIPCILTRHISTECDVMASTSGFRGSTPSSHEIQSNIKLIMMKSCHRKSTRAQEHRMYNDLYQSSPISFSHVADMSTPIEEHDIDNFRKYTGKRYKDIRLISSNKNLHPLWCQASARIQRSARWCRVCQVCWKTVL